MPLRIGIVGAGMVSQTCHIANFAANPACELAALADLRPDLARLAAQTFHIPAVYASHHELLADSSIEAVVVVTRPAATGAIVRDALRAGRHVLSEKPMAHTAEQARLLAMTAHDRGLVYAVGFMKRFDRGIEIGKACIDDARASGAYGALRHLRVYCFQGDTERATSGFAMTPEPRPDGIELWPLGPDWLAADALARYAAFLNVYSHDINLLRALAGSEPTAQSADFFLPNDGTASLACDGYGASLDLGSSANERWTEGIEATFDRATIRIALPPPFARSACARVALEANGTVTVVHPGACAENEWAFRRQADAFVASVTNGAAPRASGSDGVHDLDLIEALWRLDAAKAR